MLAHVAEWADARQLVATPTQSERRALVAAGEPGGRSASAGSAGAGSAGAEVVDQNDEDDLERSDRYGRIGFGLTCLGFVVLAVGVLARGLAAHRVPWGNMYEFAITGCLAVCAAYLVLVRRYNIRWLGLLVTGVPGHGARDRRPVPLPAGVSAGPSPALVLADDPRLVRGRRGRRVHGRRLCVGALPAAPAPRGQGRSTIRSCPAPASCGGRPSAEAIDRVAYRVHAFAFPLWTFAVMCGAIWAQYAWGRFWGWDPKEVWAFITWVVYAAYLHARATAGWQGRAAAYVALLGYATFLFNFVGINLFGSGLHSYAGM